MVMSILLDVDTSFITQEIKDFVSDLLNACLRIRNRCAHSNRLYNYFPNNAKFRYSSHLHPKMGVNEGGYRKGYGNSGISTLMASLKVLDNKSPFTLLSEGFNNSLEQLTNIYPDFKELILVEMKFSQSQIHMINKLSSPNL